MYVSTVQQLAGFSDHGKICEKWVYITLGVSKKLLTFSPINLNLSVFLHSAAIIKWTPSLDLTCENHKIVSKLHIRPNLVLWGTFSVPSESTQTSPLVQSWTRLLPKYNTIWPSVDQLQLTCRKGQYTTNIVSNAQRKKGNDHHQQQHPPEAQVLHKLLPGGAKAGQHTLAILQVWVQQRMALHRTRSNGILLRKRYRYVSNN